MAISGAEDRLAAWPERLELDRRTPRRRRRSAARVLLALVSAGWLACVTPPPPYRVPPSYVERVRALERVTLAPPKVNVYQISAGGVKEEVEDWSRAAAENVEAAFEQQLRRRSEFEFVPWTDTPARVHAESPPAAVGEGASRTPLEETWNLFEAVAGSVFVHTTDAYQQRFPTKDEGFDYTLGAEAAEVVEHTGADAFILVVAEDNISTGGRKALVALGAAVEAAVGVGGPGAGLAGVVAALVDARTGDILWFNAAGSEGGHDLRQPASAANLVGRALQGLGADDL